MKVRLGVASKLAVAISLFIVPVIVLLVLLYQSQQVAIDFGDKEAVGNNYLTALRIVHGTLVDSATTIDSAKLKGIIGDAEAKYGAEMQSGRTGESRARLAGREQSARYGSAQCPDRQDRRQVEPDSRSRSRQLLRDGPRAAEDAGTARRGPRHRRLCRRQERCCPADLGGDGGLSEADRWPRDDAQRRPRIARLGV